MRPLCHSTTAPLFQLNLSRHHIRATMPANFKGKNSRSKIAPLSRFCKKNPSITVFTKCSCLLSHILRLLSLVSCLLYMSHNCPDPGMRIPPIQFTMMTHHGIFLSLPQNWQWWLIMDYFSFSQNCPDPGMRVPPIQLTIMTHHGVFLYLSHRIVWIPARGFHLFSSQWWLIMDNFSLSQNYPDPGMRVPPI